MTLTSSVLKYGVPPSTYLAMSMLSITKNGLAYLSKRNPNSEL